MEKLKPAKFLLPAAFLFVIGVGNIWVAHFKGGQYQLVIAELSEIEPTPGLVNASPLKRIQLAQRRADRRYERLERARARQDFYRLVAYGGEVFVALSIVLFALGLMVKLRKPPSSTSSTISS